MAEIWTLSQCRVAVETLSGNIIFISPFAKTNMKTQHVVIRSVVALTIASFLTLAGTSEAVAAGGFFGADPSIQVPAAGTIEVAFSPNEGSEALVVKVIDSAHRSVRVLAYSFTAAPVAEALLRAKKRGVDVAMVVDQKENTSEDRSGKARAALSALANAGVDVRLISVYPIHHDKVVCVDGETVELGSYNYSSAAAHKNSENVFVNWHNTQLAQVYLAHFERNYRQSVPYQTRY